MSDSNRVRLTSVREVMLGVTPDNPRMRTQRMTGESLAYTPTFVTSAEMRPDRMNADPTKINETNDGAINKELTFPVDKSPESEDLASLFFNDWVNTPFRDNDGVADSAITGVAATGGVITVIAGAAFVQNHLVRTTGFASAGNNGLFKLTAGSATVPAVGDAILTDEAVPAAGARIKVVGFEGDAGDIAAIVDGLTSTALDFTTLGLVPGQWLKIGASAVGTKFATAANLGYARISGAVTAHKIPLDNLPTGWAADAGAGKGIRVFFGDQLKNGTTLISQTKERGFMDQSVPTYIAQRGMVGVQGDFTVTTEQIITYSITFNGLGGAESTASLDNSPDPASTARPMSSNVDVGRIAESGVAIGAPNFVRSLSLTINNNPRLITAVGSVGSVDIGVGDCTGTGQVETHFGSNALFQKLLRGDVGNLNFRTTKDKQTVIFGLPRITFTNGSPSAGAKNQDVMLPLAYSVSYDPLTSAHVILDRFEYVE